MVSWTSIFLAVLLQVEYKHSAMTSKIAVFTSLRVFYGPVKSGMVVFSVV